MEREPHWSDSRREAQESEHEAQESQQRIIDRTLIMIGLMILKDTLFKSGYPPELQRVMAHRIEQLLETMGVKDDSSGD